MALCPGKVAFQLFSHRAQTRQKVIEIIVGELPGRSRPSPSGDARFEAQRAAESNRLRRNSWRAMQQLAVPSSPPSSSGDDHALLSVPRSRDKHLS